MKILVGNHKVTLTPGSPRRDATSALIPTTLESPREMILRRLSASAKKHWPRIEYHRTIDSTNRYLLDLAHAGLKQNCVCFAGSQTAGRGSHGRVWQSPPGGNLYLSVLWRCKPTVKLDGLSLAIGVAVVRALEAQGLTACGLKWPNDIIVGGGKLGGILVECLSTGKQHDAVIGVGINGQLPAPSIAAIDQPVTDLTSHYGDAGVATDMAPLTAETIEQLGVSLVQFEQSGLAAFAVALKQYDLTFERAIEIEQPNRRLTGIGAGIDESGALLIRTENGRERSISGRVKLTSYPNS